MNFFWEYSLIFERGLSPFLAVKEIYFSFNDLGKVEMVLVFLWLSWGCLNVGRVLSKSGDC